jgi:hypothetical protein
MEAMPYEDSYEEELLARVAAYPLTLTPEGQKWLAGLSGQELQRHAQEYSRQAATWGEISYRDANILEAQINSPGATDETRRAIFAYCYCKYHSHFVEDAKLCDAA